MEDRIGEISEIIGMFMFTRAGNIYRDSGPAVKVSHTVVPNIRFRNTDTTQVYKIGTRNNVVQWISNKLHNAKTETRNIAIHTKYGSCKYIHY